LQLLSPTQILRLRKQKGLRILDVGCGSAIPLLYLDRFCKQKVSSYIGIDLHTERLKERYKSVEISHQFCDINLDNDWNLGTFDIVCCFEVIEHIMNDSRLFRRLCSHVDDGGCLLITTPSKAFVMKMARHFPGFDRVSEVQDGGHVRAGYSLEDFQRLAEQNQMKILSCDWVSLFAVDELRAYMARRGTAGTVLYNLRNPHREAKVKFCLGGESAQCQENYYSIAVCLKREA